MIINGLFWIPGEVPSSKGGIRRSKHGGLIYNKFTQRWMMKTQMNWLSQSSQFSILISPLPMPYYIELTFVRKTHGIFDYNNMSQSIADQMQKHNWIPRDSSRELMFYMGQFIIDQFNPGVYIRILKEKPAHEGEAEFRVFLSESHKERTKKEIREYNKLNPTGRKRRKLK